MLEPPCVMLRSAVIFLGKLNFYSVISPQRVFRQLLPPFTFTHCTRSMRQHSGGDTVKTSAANRLIGAVVQSQRRPLLGPSPG